MSKASMETAIRNDVLDAIISYLSQHYDTDVKPVSASELMMPVVDAEGNEKFALIKVSIPRGSRVDGGYEPYDGYAAAEDFAAELEEKAAKAKAREEKRAREEAERERKRAARTKKVKVDELKEKAAEIAVDMGDA